MSKMARCYMYKVKIELFEARRQEYCHKSCVETSFLQIKVVRFGWLNPFEMIHVLE